MNPSTGHDRFYLRPIKDGHVEVSGHEAHHMRHVRRVAVGDKVELFDGLGRLASATVTSIGSDTIGLNIERINSSSPREKGRIILASSLAKGDRFELLVSKCTELGVDHICPILFQRTVKRASGKNLIERYEKLMIAAVKQSRRSFLPLLNPPLEFLDSVDYLSEAYPESRWLVGSLDEDVPYLLEQVPDERDTVVFVGPEGDLTSEESQALQNRGAQSVRLVDSVLRVETAGISFVALLAARRGIKEKKQDF